MDFAGKINKINSLQAIQLLRFGTFLLISIIFANSSVATEDIGYYELSLFIASAVSFFWVTGIIQSLLPLYNNNKTFGKHSSGNRGKSAEIFNAFLVLSVFSLMAFIFCLIFQRSFYLFDGVKDISFMNLVFIYILLSNPGHLVEYVYLLRNKSEEMLIYGFWSFGLQLLLVTVPVLSGYPIEYAVKGLILISVIRLFWLGVLMKRYSMLKFSASFVREHFALGMPLIISSLLSGSAQYIDGIIVSGSFDAASFAVFRFGAKELPLVLLLANGLSNAMLPEFSGAGKVKAALSTIKKRSKRLMHMLFPISTILLFFSKVLYIAMFGERFSRSADIFMVYLLLIISRLVFPQTILIGLKRTRIILGASFVVIVLNVSLSLYMMQYYGMVGVAVATAIVFLLEKIMLILYNYFIIKIKPGEYIPVATYIFYTFLIVLVFVLLDHRIIRLH